MVHSSQEEKATEHPRTDEQKLWDARNMVEYHSALKRRKAWHHYSLDGLKDTALKPASPQGQVLYDLSHRAPEALGTETEQDGRGAWVGQCLGREERALQVTGSMPQAHLSMTERGHFMPGVFYHNTKQEHF